MNRLVTFLVVMACLPLQASVVSYKVWKAQKIQQAKQSISHLQKENKSSVKPVVKVKMKQAKTNLAIARELSPNDYFVLYLGPKYQGNAKALEAAARFMSRQELAEILVGYSNHLRQREEMPSPSFPPVLTQATPSYTR